MFKTTLDVRIDDINYGNHLGHDSLISLLHEARVRFLKSLGYSELNIESLGLLLTSITVNYTQQAFYGDKLIVSINFDKIEKFSFHLVYRVVNETTNKDIANALTVMTFYDYEKKKIAQIPVEFLDRIKNM